ncbi:MAG: multidrug effflux MFS transporter [Pseudomonadota bacterium]|nr:multidrug effflux MFS transporter [Pseudomonadota bacterium]
MSAVQSAERSRPYALSWIMLLGLLTALGPLSIDMYLPALPTMASAFGVSVSAMSNTVPAYFLGLAAGQLFYGPITDRFGRKPPLYFGLGLFIAASIWCALATDLSSLLAARTLQALGGCVGVVVARSAIRDCLSPADSSRAYAMLLLVMGVAPILAPMLGAGLLALSSWNSLFWVLALIGSVCLLLIHFNFKETLAPENRRSLAFIPVLKNYGRLLLDRRFMLPAVAGGCLMGALFVYISASSGLLIGHFGVSPQVFAWLFGANAAGLILLSQLNGRLVQRWSVLKVFQIGTGVQLLGSLVLLVLVISPLASLWTVFSALFVTVAGIGLTAPNSTALALAEQGQQAGLASALLGAMQFSIGLLGGVILHALPLAELTGIAVMMVVLIGLGALVLSRYCLEHSNHKVS